MDVPETANEQVLADCFCNLVRYAMRKTHRDVTTYGVAPDNFSVEAMNASLAAPANAVISGDQASLSMKTLLQKASGPSLTFHFYWKAQATPGPLEAVFRLSEEAYEHFKVTLLWLDLPERVPISPLMGIVDGRKPLREADMEVLRFRNGRLTPYPPPE